MKNLLLLLASFLLTISVNAQNLISLKGKVQDAHTNEPMPFAYISLKNVALGTVTDENGGFELHMPEKHLGDSITFSFLGYSPKTLAIADLVEQDHLLIKLQENAIEIEEMIVKARKSYTAKQLLKKVIKNIEQNYPQQPVNLDGYYRETVKENGAFISYADAVVSVNYAPYQEKKYKFSDYWNDLNGSMISLSPTGIPTGKTLHRQHFHYKTIEADMAKVIDSRSSDNLSQTNMISSIEGGPMGIFSNDYLKYKAAFFSDKKFKKFNFTLGELLIEGVGYVYVLSFRTTLTKEQMEKLEKKSKYKAFYKAARNKVLQGKIYIDRNDFAVIKYECSVVPEFKKYFCSYTTMNYKHFDYKLKVEYQKIGNQYYLKYLQHEDEFIYKDTITQNTTPFQAVNQFWVNHVTFDSITPFKLTEVFANLSSNQLFDLALDYNEDYWETYTNSHEVAVIPDSLRKDMEAKKILEKQFADKHLRNDSLQPPVAQAIPTKTKIHGTTLVDDYAWMKQPKKPLNNPDIKAYLEAENNYMDNYFIPLRKTQRSIFGELISRVVKEDASIPKEIEGYWYQTKWTEDDEYPIFVRRKEGQTTWDTVMNVNQMAKGKDYYRVSGYSLSPGSKQMLYFENTTGSDKSVVKFKHLETNQMLQDSLKDVTGIIWLNNHQLLYTVQEPKTLRSYQVKFHELNTPQRQDSLLFQEDDVTFSISISKSQSKHFVYIDCYSSNTNETHFANTNAIDKGFQMICPREEGHDYSVTHYESHFYITSNKDDAGFEVYRSDTLQFSKSDWKPFLQTKKGTRLTDFQMFDDFMVVGEREKMNNRLKIIHKSTGKTHYVKVKEDLHNVSIGTNLKFDSDTLRYNVSSMKSPSEVWNYNMETGDKRLVKRTPVKNYRKSKWVKNKLVWAEAKDGTLIPITLLYSNSSKYEVDEHKRMYITSYGAYGNGSEAGFNSAIFSLISRGFVYAIAHVRGGNELGSKWHDGGKMMNKMNSFTDFIDCTEFLIEKGYAQKGNIVAEGGSAGGLLMGGVVNMRPDLYKMVILNVPFVDVLNTMLDETLPLTTGEYKEWGDPNNKSAFEYMLSYSPYENVKAQDYPHLFFTTGVNDTRVGYWEPAKMVAKLRSVKTDDSLLFLRTNLSAGHGGGSGRFDYFQELSYKYALILDIFARDFVESAQEKNAANAVSNP